MPFMASWTPFLPREASPGQGSPPGPLWTQKGSSPSTCTAALALPVPQSPLWPHGGSPQPVLHWGAQGRGAHLRSAGSGPRLRTTASAGPVSLRGQAKVLRWPAKAPGSALLWPHGYYCKEPGHWEKDCDKLEHWGALRPLTRLPRVLRVPGPALRSCRGSPPPPSFFSLLVQVLFRPQSLTARPLGNLSFFFFLINVVFSPTLFQSTQIGF